MRVEKEVEETEDEIIVTETEYYDNKEQEECGEWGCVLLCIFLLPPVGILLLILKLLKDG